ncbi:InlB B-repeat-containing protein [Peptoniphilus raoultii]|uniref:InlB B-repeat-containing protein n=1 Tax=Peptoniphilus raoultii TaxID=1776387 RepID=UPI001FD65C6D|nr:InlB B-repeat-containing protein [Peptoniphilus raoultii]
MPNYDLILYAKWDEPDVQWKVTVDPAGGEVPDLDVSDLVNPNAQGEYLASKKPNEGNNQVFKVQHRQNLKNIPTPTRKGYDFLGWEWVRHLKDDEGNITGVDTSYRKTYGVPELYPFGNNLVSDVYLKAIWIENNKMQVVAYHHFIDEEGFEIKDALKKITIPEARAHFYVSASAKYQNEEWILVPNAELVNSPDPKVKGVYTEYNDRLGFNNTGFHSIKVEPKKIMNAEGDMVDNPDVKNNVFHFYYRHFKTRNYKVNYLDIRVKDKISEINASGLSEDEKKEAIEQAVNEYSIIGQEPVVSKNRHYDVRNYRSIPGWTLVSEPQQQLFYDIDENTGEFKGINGTNSDEITFYYRDSRVVERKNKDDPIPQGYIRVTFKSGDGGSFTDKDGNSVKEVYYDVLKGLKSDNLFVPQEFNEGDVKEAKKYYITPDAGKNFAKWDKKPLLNPSTIIENETPGYYTFTALYDWQGVIAKELVVTESLTGVNDFVPTEEELKAQIRWINAAGKEADLPADATVKIENYDGIYDELKELNKLDSEELVRTVLVKAKVTFNGNTEEKEVEIPIKVYKNRYEALTSGDMPKVLKDATTEPDGDLVGVTGKYVKVMVNPTGKPDEKDSKIYYVNPKALVEIPEIKLTEAEKKDLGFNYWTSDNTDVNTDGKYIFEDQGIKKRYKFEKITEIRPDFASDVVEQKDPNKKPNVPDTFVKVIVDTTDNATTATKFTKTFWVNPTKEITIPVYNPIGKVIPKTGTEPEKAWTFNEWKSDETTTRTWTSEIKGQFTQETKITAIYKDVTNIIPYNPDEPIARPDGYVRVKFEAGEGLTLSNVKYYYVKANAGITLASLAKPTVTANTGYKFDNWDKEDTLEIQAADIVVTAKATKLDTVIPEKDNNGKLNTKPDGYKEVMFVIKPEDATKGSIEGVTKFYVNPSEYVTINPPTTKASTGFEFGLWDKDTTIPTVYANDTTIIGSFNDLNDVIPKTKDDGTENIKPNGYWTVTFVIEGQGGNIANGEKSAYYVKPNTGVTINPPKTDAEIGYKFDNWNPDTTVETIYTQDTTVEGKFKKLEDIIPSTDPIGGTPNEKPVGYVTVTFVKGDHGTDITGQTVYYVNPKASKKLGDAEIVKPTVTAEIGYKFDKWDKDDSFTITKEETVTAQYNTIDDVIPEKDNNGKPNTKPEGYITVRFDKGEHGNLTGNTVFYINPNKAVVLEAKAPTINPDTGYTSAGWDTSINKAIQYQDNDVIKALYNEPGNISETEVAGYVKVEFKQGDHGTLSGTTTYWIKPGVEVNIPEPTVNPTVGYKFNKWDKGTTVTLQANTGTYEITALYEGLADIIPGDKSQPKGYVKVTFVSDDNGSLSGTTVYYVNPLKGIDLTAQADGISKTANTGYTADGGIWQDAITTKKYTSDTAYKFIFKALPDVDTIAHPGYVKVEFIADANGGLEGGNKIYYVNPLKNVKVGSNGLIVPTPVPDANYVFDKWYETIDTSEEITSSKKYVARFKLDKVKMTYKADDATTGTVPAELSYDVGTEITLAGGNDLNKDNYVLTGWKIEGTIYAPGAKFKIEKDTIAEAVWEEGLHNVEFNTNGGGYIPIQKVKHNAKITPVTNPTKENYTFIGWKVDGNDFDPATDNVMKDITLVAQYVPNVIEQTDTEKPQDTPNDFVKVIVKTTEDGVEKATDATKFEKIFWVKPNINVTINVPTPIGDTARDANGNVVTDVSGKEIKWVFKEWSSPLTAIFTEPETIITAKYESKVPEPTIDATTVETYVGKEPELSDYENAVKMKLGEDGITFDDNVSSFEITKDPDVSKPGMSEAEVKIEFNNGTIKTIKVPVKVYDNIYPGDTNGNKTSDTPTNYVKVTVVPTVLNDDSQNKTYYVNPELEVVIPLPEINAQDGARFIRWYIEGGTNPEYRGEARRFIQAETRIIAKYDRAPESGDVITEEGIYPKEQDYKDKINPPAGKTIVDLIVINPPDVSKPGITTATVEITYNDGTKDIVTIKVFVQRKLRPINPNQPNPDYPGQPNPPYRPGYPERMGTVVETIVEMKVVKVPIKDNSYRKEVRYMQGFEGEFRPYDGLTRAEAAQILANALKEDGYNYNLSYELNYKDVGDAWYTEAVKITTQANVFKGYDDGYFRPQQKITRAEWISTLRRFQEIPNGNGNHLNLRDGHWAMNEVEAAYNEGWLVIYTGGLAEFKADEPISRQEVAAVSNRAFNRVLDDTYIVRNDKSLINYKDINSSMWAYADILCASNTFLHDGKTYKGRGIDKTNITFNINTDGFEIIQDKFQRVLR